MSGFINSRGIPIKQILIGIATALAVTLLLLCVICAVINFASAIPYSLLPYIMLIADAVGGFFGAYVCAAMSKSRGLILGLICGFAVFVIMFIASLSTGETIGLITLLRFIVLIVFGALGGIKGVNKKERLHIK